MTRRIIKGYLYILPFFSLIGIVLGILRSAFQVSYVQGYLLASAGIDFLIILIAYKYMLNKKMMFLLLLLIFSTMVGLINNDLSRRFITDFTNPLFFFGKIFIFKSYWEKNDFKVYCRYYTKIAFTGSLILLPITYFYFSSEGASRLAIFPPMELPFANFMTVSGPFLIISFIIILFYGKRAQLVSAIITFFLYVVLFKRRQILKFSMLLVISMFALFFIFKNYSNNLAVIRFSSSFELFQDKSDRSGNLDKISAGRLNEFETIVNVMEPRDYFFGKGLGFVYIEYFGTIEVEATNAHFSPLGFISKYGLIFTVFIYYFFLSIFSRTNKKMLKNSSYVVALVTSIFVFLESFFAYAIFVTPILPIALGVLVSFQQRRKVRIPKLQEPNLSYK